MWTLLAIGSIVQSKVNTKARNMMVINKNVKKSLRIGLGKDIKTEHFPITVANGLDALMEPHGYKRVSQKKNNPEEFIWENDAGEQLAVGYYTKADTITCSAIFDEDLTQNKENIIKRLSAIYSNLNTIIGVISQHLGSPYISSTRELLLKIEGSTLAKKTQIIIPIMRELYAETEGVQLFKVDTLEQTGSSMKILFSCPD